MKTKTQKTGINNGRTVAAFVRTACANIRAYAKAEGSITGDARTLAGHVKENGPATEPRALAGIYNKLQAEYLSAFGADIGPAKWTNFVTTALREFKAVGFTTKAQKEKRADGGGINYIAVNVVAYVKPAEPEKAEPEKAEPEKAEPAASAAPQDSGATDTATGVHGVDAVRELLTQARKRYSVTAEQVLAVALAMVGNETRDKVLASHGYIPAEQARGMIESAVKAAKAEKVSAARRRVSKKTAK